MLSSSYRLLVLCLVLFSLLLRQDLTVSQTGLKHAVLHVSAVIDQCRFCLLELGSENLKESNMAVCVMKTVISSNLVT